MLESMSRPGLDLLVVWVTTRCQLSCRACYLGAGPVGEDLDPALVGRAIAALGLAPGAQLQIAGGEPGLVPDIVDQVASLARAAGAGRIAIQTNGLAIDDRFIALVRRHRLGVGVSLDGPPPLNDRVRGQTARVLAGLHRLEAEGIAFGVTVTLSAETLPGLVDLALMLGGFAMARSLGLDILRPLGRGADIALPRPADLAGSYRALVEALDWVNRRRQRPLVLREAGMVGCGPTESYCAAERGRAAVLVPGGGLWPCSSLVGRDGFSLGTVDHPDVSGAALRPSRTLCGSCAVSGCRGRCPARAIVSSAASALDCVLRRAAHHPSASESIRVPA